MRIVDGFLRFFAEIRVVDVDHAVGREAARIRAATGLRMPDALIGASAVVARVDVLVTKDRTWGTALAAAAPGIRVCLLEDLAA